MSRQQIAGDESTCPLCNTERNGLSPTKTCKKAILFSSRTIKLPATTDHKDLPWRRWKGQKGGIKDHKSRTFKDLLQTQRSSCFQLKTDVQKPAQFIGWSSSQTSQRPGGECVVFKAKYCLNFYNLYFDMLLNFISCQPSCISSPNLSTWLFQSTPIHTVNSKDILEWPAQSPDLNPIELLQKQLDSMVQWKIPSSQSIIWDMLQEAQGEISSDYLEELTARMPKVYQAVIPAKGV